VCVDIIVIVCTVNYTRVYVGVLSGDEIVIVTTTTTDDDGDEMTTMMIPEIDDVLPSFVQFYHRSLGHAG